MPAPKKKNGGFGSQSVNPVPVIIVAVVVVAVFVYAMFIRPGQQAAAIAKNWSSPEEAAKRSPEGRPKDQAYEDKVKELLAKEGRAGKAGHSRRDQ